MRFQRLRSRFGLGSATAIAALAMTAGTAGAVPQRAVCPGPAQAAKARCFAHVVTDGRGTPATAPAPPAGWYGPAQFHTGYALPTTPTEGSPAQTIAIVDAYDDPTIRSDLTEYDRAYGIPNLLSCASTSTTEGGCFLKVNQKGEAKNYPKANAGWALEIALDVETAHQICQTCKVVLVEASSNSGANLNAAEDEAIVLGATEISNSWGTESEYSGELAENGHFDHPGVAITVASGDNGYNKFGYPASSPDVIAVGGTTLKLTSAYGWSSETTWSGSGSGCSLYFEAKSWQPSASNWSAAGCGSKRGVADVAADANPETGAAVYDTTKYYGQVGWFHVGGTSLASPLIAGVYALAGNAASVSYPALLPYGNTSALHDVIGGSSTGNCSTTACKPGPGYDGPTGLGTPNGIGAF